MLKAAIIGCGKIADAHAEQILRIKGCEIVGAYDREPLMAKQLCDRYPIARPYSDLEALLSDAKPDVVHITTPPQSHFDLGETCLRAGANIYVEKPFTLYEEDTRRLLRIAEDRGLSVTVGHDYQFGNAARRMRALVDSGYLGGRPVHIESYYCYELTRSGYSGALLSDKNHWVRRLPGKLLHNIISHGIARIAEFMETDSPQVIAHGFVSPLLRSMGEREIVDELRVIINEQDRTTAYFTFSSQMRPAINQLRLYGENNGLVLDHDTETLIRLRGKRYTSFANHFIQPATFAKQYLGNLATNVSSFGHRDFHFKNGLRYLIESFYRSIVDGTPPPISHREIILTATVMDAIFAQLREQHPQDGPAEPVEGLARAR